MKQRGLMFVTEVCLKRVPLRQCARDMVSNAPFVGKYSLYSCAAKTWASVMQVDWTFGNVKHCRPTPLRSEAREVCPRLQYTKRHAW